MGRSCRLWGSQTAIAQQILDQQGDYVLALKGNQATLQADVIDCFQEFANNVGGPLSPMTDTPIEKAHGRLARRTATVITDAATLAWLQAQQHWPGLTALGRIASERRLSSGVSTQDTRYYALSSPLTASQFQRAVRLHRGIEKQVHRVLGLALGKTGLMFVSVMVPKISRSFAV